MLFGLMCGDLLRSKRRNWFKLLILLLAGLGGLASGGLLDLMNICPAVKRIWTPSWALFSTGWCCLILFGLYAVVDVLKFRKWTFPLVVVGANSIAIYCMTQLLSRWVADSWATHLRPLLAEAWSRYPEWCQLYEPMVRCVAVGVVFWLICWWMYRRKIFIRI